MRVPWTRERLVHERTIALGCAIERSSLASYSSAFHSYMSFCFAHGFSLEPTPDTLSFFMVYMCHHIKPLNLICLGSAMSSNPFIPMFAMHGAIALLLKLLQGARNFDPQASFTNSPFRVLS